MKEEIFNAIEEAQNKLTDKYFCKYVKKFLEDENERNYWIDKGINEHDLNDLLMSVAIFIAGQVRQKIEKDIKKVGQSKK